MLEQDVPTILSAGTAGGEEPLPLVEMGEENLKGISSLLV